MSSGATGVLTLDGDAERRRVTMPECDACGAHVSKQFVRVFGHVGVFGRGDRVAGRLQ